MARVSGENQRIQTSHPEIGSAAAAINHAIAAREAPRADCHPARLASTNRQWPYCSALLFVTLPLDALGRVVGGSLITPADVIASVIATITLARLAAGHYRIRWNLGNPIVIFSAVPGGRCDVGDFVTRLIVDRGERIRAGGRRVHHAARVRRTRQ